ncbi:hypothetical protein PoB_003100600 [Plakobranchus ocellatus]|uniref:Uncharacterized protein n=1 Tax=Plakobranchus ocellatus TaxID=259542 RepID=A0AAV4ACW6_9GAST|nr:hypothetical protein PoB_003100600 [Plakobranchus ocellatus]
MPDSVKAVTGIAKRLFLIFLKVALGEQCVAHPKSTHHRLVFYLLFTSFAEVFSKVGEYFEELVSPSVSQFSCLPVWMYAFTLGFRSDQQMSFPENDALFNAAFERSTPSSIRVRVNKVPTLWGVGLSIISSTRGLLWVEGDSKKRSRRTIAHEKKWGRKTKQGGEKVLLPMYWREAVHGRPSVVVASYDTHSTVGKFYPRLHMGRKGSIGQQEK